MSQPEYINLVGVQSRDRKLDAIVFQTKSYNSAYSDVIVKAGVNPIIPDGYELLKKDVDSQTGITTLTTAKRATVEYKPATINAPAAVTAPLPPVGLAVNVDKLKDIERIKAVIESGESPLRAATSQPQPVDMPKTHVDTILQQNRTLSALTTYAPSKVATKLFTGDQDMDTDIWSSFDVMLLVGIVFIVFILVTITVWNQRAPGKPREYASLLFGI